MPEYYESFPSDAEIAPYPRASDSEIEPSAAIC